MKYGQNLSNIVDLQGLSLEVQHPPAVPLPNHAFSQLYPSFVGLHFIWMFDCHAHKVLDLIDWGYFLESADEEWVKAWKLG